MIRLWSKFFWIVSLIQKLAMEGLVTDDWLKKGYELNLPAQRPICSPGPRDPQNQQYNLRYIWRQGSASREENIKAVS